MEGQSRKWMILVAITVVQAFTGTNFDFAAYSSTLKSVLGISQLQLNYLSVASDMGKVFGWCSGVFLLYLPLWLVMFLAGFMGLLGYGLQWLVIQQLITMPYFLVFFMCLLAGCSICWFNTVCFVLCIQNFPINRSLSLSLTISYNGISAALYTLLANAITPQDSTIYLFLNAVVPLFTSSLAFVPVLCQPPSLPLSIAAPPPRNDYIVFVLLNIIAVVTGIYLLFLNTLPFEASAAHILALSAAFLLILPFFMPGIVYARDWTYRTIHKAFGIDPNVIDLNQTLIVSENGNNNNDNEDDNGNSFCFKESQGIGIFGKVIENKRIKRLGEEHNAWLLVRRWDFWLYYMAYFCGGTIGLVFSNNLGQIAESLGHHSKINSLVALYSSCSFFGRLLAAAPDFLHDKVNLARTGWLALALVPTPLAFLLLATSVSEVALQAGTAMVGLSSGFVIAAAVSITSELFGPNSTGVNHNIVITNIPIGSLLFGLFAALIYDSHAELELQAALVCMGRHCYLASFICWGLVSLLGLISSFLLFIRTKPAYDRLETKQSRTEFS